MISKDFSPTTKICKGNLLSTFRVLLAIGFLIFLAYMVLDNPKVFTESPGALVVVSFAGIFIIAITVFQLYYFIIDGDQFVVKNQILIWTKTTFELKNILEIEFVDKLTAGSSRAFSLRVVNKNAKSKVYWASSLDKKTWQVLLDDLKKKKILVNDSGTQFDNYADNPSSDAGPSDEG